MQVFVIINNVGNEDKCRCECKELIEKGRWVRLVLLISILAMKQ